MIEAIPLDHVVLVATTVFGIGLYGVLSRRNAVAILMAIESRMVTRWIEKAQKRIDEKAARLGGKKGRYDTETKHGTEASAQARWDTLFSKCIESKKNLPDK